MNKNVAKGKASEAKVMAYLKKNGASRLTAIGKGCSATKGEEISWAFSVCKRLVAQGLVTKNKVGNSVFYNLLVQDGGSTK